MAGVTGRSWVGAIGVVLLAVLALSCGGDDDRSPAEPAATEPLDGARDAPLGVDLPFTPLPPARWGGVSLWPAAPDDLRSTVELPRAEHRVDAPADEILLEVLRAHDDDGWWVNGRRVESLVEHLAPIADTDRDSDHIYQASRRPVLLTLDERVAWGVVLEAVHVFTQISVRRVFVAVAAADGAAGPAVVPLRLAHLEEDRVPTWDIGYRLELTRPEDETHLRGRSRRGPAGPLAEILPEILREMKERHTPGEYDTVRLLAPVAMPLREVLPVLDAARGAGYDRVAFLRLVALGMALTRGPGRGSLEVAPSVPGTVRRALEMPVAGQGKPETTDHEVVEFVLTEKDDGVWVGGRSYDHRALARYLQLRADTSREAAVPRASNVGVLITADARAPWQRIQWAMQAAAHPDIRIYRIWWNVRLGADEDEGQLRMFLPMDMRPSPNPVAEIDLRVEEGSRPKVLLVRLSDRREVDLGGGEAALAKTTKQMTTLHGRDPNAAVLIRGARDVPFGSVVSVVDAILASGLTGIQLAGGPPPPGR